jgi:hypothetical protein
VGQEQHPQKALLIAGILYNNGIDPSTVFDCLEDDFGAIALHSRSFPFVETDYYREEMGDELTRQWVAFHRCVEQDEIVSAKLRCNQIERRYFSRGRKRLVNIDPGYLTLGKVVLATTKDNQHRLYLRDGIYGEVTLRYRHRSYEPWEWTYRDYRREEALHFFEQARSLYREMIIGEKEDGPS